MTAAASLNPALKLDKSDPLYALTAYQWEPQPQAAAFVKKVVDDFLEKLPEARAFADRLYRETGNRFGDLVEEIDLPDSIAGREQLEALGWRASREQEDEAIFTNATGIFPDVQLVDDGMLRIGFKVENLMDLLAATGWGYEVHGHYGSLYRLCELGGKDDVRWSAHDRRGSRTYTYYDLNEVDFLKQLEWLDVFRTRTRSQGETDERMLATLDAVLDIAIKQLGRDLTCDLFFAAEREYWQRRNAAAQFQKARQDKLGIGWANHDHHTYRSSRRYFHKLVALWEKLGFECRERFYPGPEAGWGAQVMEQPVCGIVTFNDVDISPEELKTDFAHDPMQERDHLGTIGLWCGLHGESVLQAGMHHLECTFDFEALQEQMKTEAGIETMPKFSDFAFLKQAFTKGERWAVDPARVDALLAKNLITEHQAKEFKKNGALGSHLENLERNDGFKGFNQTGVTAIIHATDPRKQV